MRYFRIICLAFTICSLSITAKSQQQQYQAAGNRNPLLPGYFADPTIKKFGDTYYIYATTDGNGGGLGPSQVWTSKDFVNWTYQDMNWPTTHNYWAPDVAHGNDGLYYLYYCQPTVEVYGASSSSPTGPWTSLYPDNKPVIPNYLVPKVITLDGQTFRDDDGKFYMTWGTWGIYPGFGCGVGLLNPDMKSFAKTAQIPNTLAKDFFEGSFMFKRNGIYYLMYSSGYCEDGSYRVQYATSKKGPMEGFEFGKNNPILSTSADGTVHGPGHNSVLQLGNDYYIVYHRHNNPHAGGGYNRQVCADKLIFDADGNIEKIVPTHTGVGYLGKNTNPFPDLAYKKPVTASSFYSDDFRPSFANDQNNGTLWKSGNNTTAPAWVQVDLEKVQRVKRVLTQFEYAIWYYQYKIEYSTDGKNWTMFADKTNNTWHGSPAVDEGDVMARYLRLTITNTEFPGIYKAIWNFSVYSGGTSPQMPANINPKKPAEKYTQKGLLLNLDADLLSPGKTINTWDNAGALGGSFQAKDHAPVTDIIDGKKAVVFTGKQSLVSSFNVPRSLAGNNSYTVAYWVYAPHMKEENPLLSWAQGGDQLTGAIFGYGSNRDMGAAQHFGFADIQFKRTPMADKWHYVVITFDGTFEKVFIDGELNNTENKTLFIHPDENFWLGSKHNGQAYFTGALASLQVYDGPLTDIAIERLYHQVKAPAIAVYLDASKLPYQKLSEWSNEGALKGMLKAADNTQPQVQDIGGRIAVSFTGKQSITLDTALTLNKHYTVAFSEFLTNAGAKTSLVSLGDNMMIHGAISPGKWHYIIKSVNGDDIKTYVDGTLQSTTSPANLNNADNKLIIGFNNNNTVSGALASLCIYNYAINAEEAKNNNDLWQQNLHAPIVGDARFKQAPKALSPTMVSMQADEDAKPVADLQYNFIRTTSHTPAKQSGWVTNAYYVDYGLSPNQKYEYSFEIKDNLGNVTPVTPIVSVSTDSKQFNILSDDFSVSKDYTANGTSGSVWDGMIGTAGNSNAIKIKTDGKDSLELQSHDTNWDGTSPYGPFLYKNVKGNFVAEVEVSEVSGLKQKKTTNNDAGLMIRAANDSATGKRHERLLQNSIFPAWNVGNMLTNLYLGNREQLNIHSGWNYNKFLQIQREGNLFYVRTSNDRINWTDLPGSPVSRPDLDQKTVQVGLYQCTYGPTDGYAIFSNFKLVLSK